MFFTKAGLNTWLVLVWLNDEIQIQNTTLQPVLNGSHYFVTYQPEL
jgi:hypothetical protein